MLDSNIFYLGINLANIIKDLKINESTGQPVLNETISNLKRHSENTEVLSREQLDKELVQLISELNKSVPYRVRAQRLDTQKCLLNLIEAEIAKEGDVHSENSVSS